MWFENVKTNAKFFITNIMHQEQLLKDAAFKKIEIIEEKLVKKSKKDDETPKGE